MRKTKEILRLRFEVGLGLRQIVRSCSIGHGTVHVSGGSHVAAWGGLGRRSVGDGPVSALHHGLDPPRCRCRILPSFTSSGSCIHT